MIYQINTLHYTTLPPWKNPDPAVSILLLFQNPVGSLNFSSTCTLWSSSQKNKIWQTSTTLLSVTMEQVLWNVVLLERCVVCLFHLNFVEFSFPLLQCNLLSLTCSRLFFSLFLSFPFPPSLSLVTSSLIPTSHFSFPVVLLHSYLFARTNVYLFDCLFFINCFFFYF